MKKILTIFAAAVAALTLASCNKDDSVYENNNAIAQELKVNAYLDEPATKAANEVVNTTTADLASFKMYAFSDDKSVISGDQYDRKGTAGAYTWSTTNTYYWNSVGKYEFIAVAEDNAACSSFFGGAFSVDKDGIACKEFKVAKTGKQKDPVVATTGAATAPTDGKIDLKFQHILSRVRVNPTISIDNNVKLKAKVLSWTFKGVATEGYFTSSTDASDIAWATSTTGDVTNDYTDVKTGQTWNNVIPGDNVVATLILKVEFSDMNDVKIKDRYFTVDAKDIKDAVKKYAQGYQYTYNLTVKNDGGKDTDDDGDDSELVKIVVNSVTVEPWQSQDGGSFTFEAKN